ncbi:hypothetical protein GJU40_15090 [Bacillus lacus]|uniref:Lipocalin-like domain-containing protein n=1 Tax=Metabacillus lacus TaxID=1983721 RepID=A0A7X2J1M8_9BACI|nr:hypothetical protein [Metabacillus lacus]MRX73467.1 hypothetical protein [Metabacillus lacus]
MFKKKTVSILCSIVILTTLVFSVPKVDAANPAASTIFKGLWYVIQALDNKYYSVPKSVTTTQYAVTTTPGSVAFNEGKNGGIAQIDFNVTSTGHSVNLYASTSPTGLVTLRKINLSVSKGSSLLASKSAHHTQYLFYRPNSTGNHYARFTTTEKRTWTPYVSYRFDAGGLPVGGSSIVANAVPVTVSDEDLINAPSGTYLKPSEEHMNIVPEKPTKSLNLSELNMQFFDETLEMPVLKMKDYETGDTVLFSDTLSKVEYESETDQSNLYFISNEEPIQFKGDLTNSYFKGDKINLSFKVVSLDEEFGLNTVDYLKNYLDSDLVPHIEEYIVD